MLILRLDTIKEKPEHELYDAAKSKAPAKLKAQAEAQAVANPLPSHKESADLSTRSSNTGKQGVWDDWNTFRAQRMREYEAASMF